MFILAPQTDFQDEDQGSAASRVPYSTIHPSTYQAGWLSLRPPRIRQLANGGPHDDHSAGCIAFILVLGSSSGPKHDHAAGCTSFCVPLHYDIPL